MKLSGFTFIRNGIQLGFPFEASIRSLLPLVDEFVIVAGHGADNTLARVQAIGDPKIQIIQTHWNENLADRGFVYAQQKMIAQYACSGDWAFYLEGDEVLHEEDLPKIKASLEAHHNDPRVEALVFDYYHFYGSPKWIATSPEWYRRECRLIRNTIRTFAPDGQYWVVMDKNRKGRAPRAALANAHIYHYGHARKIHYLQNKVDQVSKYWGSAAPKVGYHIDPQALTRFSGSHPAIVQEWLRGHAEDDFSPNSNHVLTRRERKHRWSMKVEKLLGIDLSRKHYKLIK
jgi:glycosyltransferase involved in cell wall biosynthesis